MSSYRIRYKTRHHIPEGAQELVKLIMRNPRKESVFCLLDVLSQCHTANDFHVTGRVLVESLRRHLPNDADQIAKLLNFIYSTNVFDDNAPAAVAELIIENFGPGKLRKLLKGKGTICTGGPAQVENLLGECLDTDEMPGRGLRDFDVVWTKKASRTVSEFESGWGLEVKLAAKNYYDEPAFHRKLRYLQHVSCVANNWTSKVVTIREAGDGAFFAKCAQTANVTKVELITALELFNMVSR